MKRYRIQLLGISEAKKKGSGEKSLKDNYMLRYSRAKTGRTKQGVAIITSKDMEERVLEWSPISSRIMTLSLPKKIHQ